MVNHWGCLVGARPRLATSFEIHKEMPSESIPLKLELLFFPPDLQCGDTLHDGLIAVLVDVDTVKPVICTNR